MDAFSSVGSPTYGFWATIWALTATVAMLWALGYVFWSARRHRRITWDLHSEYIDISEFSNRNIPLRVTYRGTEPRWLWAAYLSLRNTGRVDIKADDNPEKQHFVVGHPGCRYIGFNRLVSEKAKVNLSPLFIENDVYCKIEFDSLGSGDEILCSLLFIADEKQRVELQGNLFGKGSQIISGYRQRLIAWRSLWWLLIAAILIGIIGGTIYIFQAAYYRQAAIYQFYILGTVYFLALLTAGLLLRPIRFWQEIPERFQLTHAERRNRWRRVLKFLFGISEQV